MKKKSHLVKRTKRSVVDNADSGFIERISKPANAAGCEPPIAMFANDGMRTIPLQINGRKIAYIRLHKDATVEDEKMAARGFLRALEGATLKEILVGPLGISVILA